MNRTEIAKLYADPKEGEVVVAGWIKTIRDSKAL